jgi:hypothetical protein
MGRLSMFFSRPPGPLEFFPSGASEVRNHEHVKSMKRASPLRLTPQRPTSRAPSPVKHGRRSSGIRQPPADLFEGRSTRSSRALREAMADHVGETRAPRAPPAPRVPRRSRGVAVECARSIPVGARSRPARRSGGSEAAQAAARHFVGGGSLASQPNFVIAGRQDRRSLLRRELEAKTRRSRRELGSLLRRADGSNPFGGGQGEGSPRARRLPITGVARSVIELRGLAREDLRAGLVHKRGSDQEPRLHQRRRSTSPT